MSRDLATARAVVGIVAGHIMATSLGDQLVGTFELAVALDEAVSDVADLLDPAEKFDAEV